jgi:hypothetical protein
MYNVQLNGFVLRCFSWEEVERYVTSAAEFRAKGVNEQFGVEYDEIMDQVLEDNADYLKEERR